MQAIMANVRLAVGNYRDEHRGKTPRSVWLRLDQYRHWSEARRRYHESPPLKRDRDMTVHLMWLQLEGVVTNCGAIDQDPIAKAVE